jgi:hypothetical protein
VDCLYEQEFASLLIDVLLDIMQAHFHSSVGVGANAWLLTHPTTLTFRLFLADFIITLHVRLDLPHPMVIHLSSCQRDHTIDNLGFHLF